MKKLLIASFAAAALCSCGGANYTITGHYELPPGDSVYLYASDNTVLAAGVVGADTTISLKGSVTTPEMVSLTDRYKTSAATIFLEPGKIRIETYAPNRGYIVSGTPLNDKYKAFNDAMAAFGEKLRKGSPGQTLQDILAEMNELYTRTINANLDNIFGVWVFNSYEFEQIKNDPGKIKARLAQFTPEMQAHPMLKRTQTQAVTPAQTAIGQPYTDLAMKNADNETVQLSSLVGPGRWVLLDFWATWCGPCCREIPHLKEAYAAFSGRGFAIYAVSIDHDAARWRQFLAENSLPWTNVLSPGEGKQSPAAAMYGIRFIPSNFLISPDGTIAARNLPGKQLQARLEELMK